jgi:hypothetical protein
VVWLSPGPGRQQEGALRPLSEQLRSIIRQRNKPGSSRSRCGNALLLLVVVVVVGEVQVSVCSQGQELRVVEAAAVRAVLGQRVPELGDGCIGAAEAGGPAL